MAGADCEWILSGGPNGNNVLTALGTSTTCPNSDNLVGIGTALPLAKLHVERDNTSGGPGYAGYFGITGSNTDKVGVQMQVNGTGSNHTGLQVHGNDAAYWNKGVESSASIGAFSTVTNTFNVGVESLAWVKEGSTCEENYGVYANAKSDATTTGIGFGVFGYASGATANYGVFGAAGGGTTNFAGYFAGNTQCGATFFSSDANLKTDIAAAEPDQLVQVLQALDVHTYQFDNAMYPQLHLPEGPQVGLIAQEIEELLPGLVMDAVHPMERDEEGNVLHEAVPFKGVNYVGLIPYLIAGYQAQQAQIDGLQELLAACCAGGMVPQTEPRNAEGTISGNARALSINPNPFVGQTTLTYTVERSGRMQLLANSADGKELRTLEQADMVAGQYTYVWNTADLAPGIYYVTLLLDGEPIVKKAVRVSE